MNFKLKSLKGFFWTRLKKKQSVSLLRLPLKGPLENELNGNEKWHHYYYCSSSIADVSILQITFLATLRGFSLNTSSFTATEKKLMAQKFPYMALSKLLGKQEKYRWYLQQTLF